MEPVTRRQFFATAATASGAAILLAACSDDTQSASDNGASSAAEGSAPVIGLISSDLYASPNPQRVAFAIAQGASFIDAGDVNVTFKDEAGTVLGTSTASYHGDGLPKNRGIYVCEATLTSAGTHTIHVETTKGTQPQDTLASVTPVTSATPVNVAAPKAASPTPTDTLGVQPICTYSRLHIARAFFERGHRKRQAHCGPFRYAGPLPVSVLRTGARYFPRRTQGARIREPPSSARRDLQGRHQPRLGADPRRLALTKRTVVVLRQR